MKNFSYRLARKIALLKMRLCGTTRPSSYPYISGDTFRTLADHLFDETSRLNPTDVNAGDIVFVKSDLLDEFFDSAHVEIVHPYILITHNSDKNIAARDVARIDEKIIHWFAQNALVSHPKLTPIPIGLENAHYHMHGVTRMFDILRDKKTEKKSRILFGFNIHTNPQERHAAHDILLSCTTADQIAGYLIPASYLRLLHTYQFVASPAGNGVDCHRTWEALYLGTVPIVRRSACIESFQQLGLPLWVIDDWTELLSHTVDSLRQKYDALQTTSSFNSLDFDYWKNLIYSYRTQAHTEQ